jgi:hypothetical protein
MLLPRFPSQPDRLPSNNEGMKIIKFSYPRRGMTGVFNTFRLGSKWAVECPAGTDVELVDARSGKLLKRATVLSVHLGTLEGLAPLHAEWAHNWRDYPETERPALLIASMKKRFFPGRVLDNSPCSVIYLREIQT